LYVFVAIFLLVYILFLANGMRLYSISINREESISGGPKKPPTGTNSKEKNKGITRAVQAKENS